MSLARSFLGFVGIRAAGIDEATLNKGKRRVVTYLAFMCLVLFAAACDDEEWVKGGFQYNNRRRALSPTGALDGADAALFGEPETGALAGSADANLGAPIPANTRYFAIGLTKAEQSGNWYAPNSGKTLQRVCSSNIKSYIATWNAGTAENPNGWNAPQVGAKPIKVDTFTDTLGLMGFATAIQGVVWLLMAAVQYDVPVVSTHKATIVAVRLGLCVSLFFAFLGVVVFGSSPIKDEFCKTFDPDAYITGIGCGFGAAFDMAIAAIVFTAINAVLASAWMPGDISQEYAFSEKAGGISGGSAEPSAPSIFSGSAYSASAASHQPVLAESLVPEKKKGGESAFSGSSFQDADL